MSELAEDAPLSAEEIQRARWRRAARAKMARETPERREARLAANRARAAARRLNDPIGEARKQKRYAREYGQRHPERRRARHAAYREANRERFRDYWRQRKARHRGAECADTEAHIAYVAVLLCDPCAYCGADAASIDHIDPLANGGSDEWDNLTAACASCNSSKHAMTLLETLAWQR